ncbi:MULTISPECIES: glycosyltransferase [Acidianus]|uniref:Polysaccharide biosynthesis protein n=1 Tax=Candidatus Acidianus copahuensis TaxID=1160895 RepID=A0A031LLN3_9CREN|nr:MULTISPECIES: glycosyltransferase [Acidianus]EZQ01798.1 polysaccharide biosynthesis protein [Candidatus Acidianus copahuensis]NON62142.1 polysaccharide biosynthesis protein [Acidianus sp. RZ1]
MKELLIIASGGGHTGFARAVAQYLPIKADFVVPEGDNLSISMIKPYADKIYQVPKFRTPSKGTSISLIWRSFISSLSLQKYKKVLATGSNHSILPSFIEFLKGAKIYVIESQDRIVTRGKAVRIISRFSSNVFLHWEEQKRLYKNGIVVGPIVEKPRYEPKDEGYILLSAGSEGFRKLFDTLYSQGIENVVLQSGKVDPSLYPKWKAFAYDQNLEKWIANASVVITHQGKTAMESVVYGKPTIIVYNKEWKRAATLEDTKRYAEILGASFLESPSSKLIELIKEKRKPKILVPGTQKLVEFLIG